MIGLQFQPRNATGTAGYAWELLPYGVVILQNALLVTIVFLGILGLTEYSLLSVDGRLLFIAGC